MNQETVIALALEAKADMYSSDRVEFWVPNLLKFADLVAAAERERCAQICEDHFSSDGDWCAKQIRSSEVGRG